MWVVSIVENMDWVPAAYFKSEERANEYVQYLATVQEFGRVNYEPEQYIAGLK